MKRLDVIIPVFNEEKAIGHLVQRIDTALTKAKIAYTLLIVDDHSTDKTIRKIKSLQRKYPIKLLIKQGKPGKAYSILEASKEATAEYVAMIDGDLQYPPEALPKMLKLATKHGMAVARRITYDGSKLRRFGSRALAFVCGRILHGISCDMQSGLKVFRKEFLEEIDTKHLTAWALDLPLLHIVKERGYSIAQVEIPFKPRPFGDSKLTLLKPTIDIVCGAIGLKFKKLPPKPIAPTRKKNMIGAGVLHNKQRFITHTTLSPAHSALHTLTFTQKRIALLLLGLLAVGIYTHPWTTAIVVTATLSFVYFVDVLFNFYLILKSLHSPPEIHITPAEIKKLSSASLPVYTILCPLYREAHVLPQFLHNIAKLDWPKKKLDVMLLLEEDDTPSLEAIKTIRLPSYVRVVVVPHSTPKTKPKACNYGLNLAKGEYLVIYDAEDAPDPLQLKKSYLAFQKVDPTVKCLQAKLNYYNPHQNWLTRLFTAEYSLWFDVTLTGLQSIETTIPLGGTSNHFRTKDLRALQGWDPFNVTEDCDLGVRLFKHGYKTAIIDSTTLEEANSNPKNWIRQRSRWIKGYMQTYLLHMRHPIEFAKSQGIHALLFQLTVGGKLAFILINPFLWILTILYFAANATVGPTIEALYPAPVFYMAVTSLLFGNFLFLYYYMIGCAKREHWSLMKWVYLVPFYWLMVSMAGAVALYQLIVKPHYWEKTIHGLHLSPAAQKAAKKLIAEVAASADTAQLTPGVPRLFVSRAFIRKLTLLQSQLQFKSLSTTVGMLASPERLWGMGFLVATMVANVLNMGTNIVLGRMLTLEQFGVFSVITSSLYLTGIPISAFSGTVNYKASFLLGHYKQKSLLAFWKYIRARAFFVGLICTGMFLILSPKLYAISTTESLMITINIALILFLSIVGAVDTGYLNAKLDYRNLSLITLIGPLVRLSCAIGLSLLIPQFAYVSITIGILAVYLQAFYGARFGEEGPARKYEFHLPRTFFFASLITGCSSIAFFSLDNLLVAHILGAREAGQYALLGLFGKMIFFVGGMSSVFLGPLVARAEGAGKTTHQIFRWSLLAVTAMSAVSYVAFTLVLPRLGEPYFGDRIQEVAALLPVYGMGVAAFTIAQVIVSYYLLKKQYIFPIMSLALALLQIGLLLIVPATLTTIVTSMSFIGLTHLVTFLSFHLAAKKLRVPARFISELVALFGRLPKQPTQKDKLSILIFNWRDKKHVWAGGAEEYIHNVAKRLVSQGHSVTLFAGNDGRHTRHEKIDGVQIVRRGGFYTVYLWAFVYYIFRFRGKFDVVVDSENGIPFLTPLFVRVPIFLLIHHVHQNVFRDHLQFPLKQIAMFIEGELMPLLYRTANIITVSESSKEDILSLGLGNPEAITIVNPGIETSKLGTGVKTAHPSMCYVGRLKSYKNIDVAIKAFSHVRKFFPTATFTIAGTGESEQELKSLVKQLKLTKAIRFVGFVSSQKKKQILSESWLSVQPSMVEGWGITVIEANACGTPVVASNVEGLKDSVRHNKTGLLVPPKDTAAFAKAIEKLFTSDKLRASLSTEALKWSQSFEWDNSTKRFVLALHAGRQQSQHIDGVPAKPALSKA